jgi:hypothetical protein
MPHRTGGVRDFDLLDGSWAVHNRTLRANADGSEEWIEYPSTNRMTMHLDSAGLTGTGCDGGDVGR